MVIVGGRQLGGRERLSDAGVSRTPSKSRHKRRWRRAYRAEAFLVEVKLTRSLMPSSLCSRKQISALGDSPATYHQPQRQSAIVSQPQSATVSHDQPQCSSSTSRIHLQPNIPNLHPTLPPATVAASAECIVESRHRAIVPCSSCIAARSLCAALPYRLHNLAFTDSLFALAVQAISSHLTVFCFQVTRPFWQLQFVGSPLNTSLGSLKFTHVYQILFCIHSPLHRNLTCKRDLSMPIA
jgi:hypothetical protein